MSPSPPPPKDDDEEFVHQAFGVFRREVARVSTQFRSRVEQSVAFAGRRKPDATVVSMLGAVVIEALNAVSRITSRQRPADSEDEIDR